MVYDKDYHDEYVRRADTEIGKEIYECRWNLIKSYCSGGTLLDYGCGSGAFHLSAPNRFNAYGYDVNYYTGFYRMPSIKRFHIITMWDSIEHLTDPLEPIKKYKPNLIFITTPNIDNVKEIPVKEWRHFKPGEHLHYFSLRSLEAILEGINYKIINYGFEEGCIRNPERPGDILTVVACLSTYQ